MNREDFPLMIRFGLWLEEQWWKLFRDHPDARLWKVIRERLDP